MLPNKQKKLNVFVVLMAVMVVFSLPVVATAQEVNDVNLVDPNLEAELQMPGSIEGTGTYFEVNDSNYLNITLESSEPVHLILESVPEMVVMDIEAAEGASSTQITLTGFAPATTYYKYQDDYHNLMTFTTDPNGSTTYTQDLNEPHLVFIQPRASTIFLSASGWSDPTVGTWDATTQTGTLITDVYETIQIDSDGITLDGNGKTITGSNTGSGVYLNGRTGVTIKNVSVQGFNWGIRLSYSTGNTLTANTASNNSTIGITLYGSEGNTLTDNTANSNLGGISLYDSGGSTLTHNTTRFNREGGIHLSYSGGSTLTDNTASNSDKGIYLSNSGGSTLTDNTANSNRWGIYISRSANSTLTHNTVSNTPKLAIYLTYSDNSTLTGNTASNNSVGIRLNRCLSSILTGNTASNNSRGIGLWWSHYSTLTGNIANYNSAEGIYISDCIGNILTGNTTSNNRSGISVWYRGCHTLTDNTTSNNDFGIYIRSSRNNLIYNNNFIGNGTQAYVYGGSVNLFNQPAPMGGNYWSDWTTPDDDLDGFVDLPYVFYGGQDNLPWTSQDAWPVAPIFCWACSTLKPSNVEFTSLTLTWWTPVVSTVGGIAEYLVFENDTLLATMAGSETTYQVTGLEHSTEYTFKVEACDVAGNCSTNGPSVTVRTLTPLQAILKLIGEVATLNLQHGIDNELDVKLNSALGALDDINQNNDVAAINTLGAFITAVEAQSGKKIQVDDADALIAAAQEIIAVLSGT